MKRLTAATLTATLTLSMMTMTTQAQAQGWRWRRCKFQTVEAGKWTVNEVKLTIECAVQHWPVSLDHALYVANRESGFRWDATNATSGACGVFQHLPEFWPIRQDNFDRLYPRWHIRESCYNARSNILVAIWMAHTGGWAPWGG